MSYVLEFTDTAMEDIDKHKKAGDKAVLKKIDKLLKELREHPTTGTGQPEKMKHEYSGSYSRLINKKHRLLYSIKDEIVTVYVLNLWGHYEDK
jgi:toxin YoeB